MNNKLLLIFLPLFFVASCYEFGEVEIKQVSGGILFSVPQEYINSKNADSYILSGLSVVIDNCSQDCIVWTIVRKTNKKINSNNTPIKFGAVPANMKETISARALKAGTYSISASLGLTKNKEIISSGVIYGKFELVQKSGKSGFMLKSH